MERGCRHEGGDRSPQELVYKVHGNSLLRKGVKLRAKEAEDVRAALASALSTADSCSATCDGRRNGASNHPPAGDRRSSSPSSAPPMAPPSASPCVTRASGGTDEGVRPQRAGSASEPAMARAVARWAEPLRGPCERQREHTRGLEDGRSAVWPKHTFPREPFYPCILVFRA